MAFEQYFASEWKPIPSESADSEVTSPCFDCNICLDFANDPVVTLCGHLYCWPCLYKWFQFQADLLDPDDHPQCPVCKAQISRSTLVPLYGRGQAQSEAQTEGKAYLDMPIPPRPPAFGPHVLMTSSNHGQQLPYRNAYQNPHYPPQFDEEDSSRPLFNLADNTVGMFGEMVYARVFGNSESLYAYPNSYHLVGSSSPRLRRQEMQADKCLNRISIFLMCCLFLCLLLF